MRRTLPAFALFAALAVIPGIIVNPYYIHLLTAIVIFTIVLIGLDLIVGYVGEISLGHFGLFGIGAYAAGILVVNAGWPLLPALALAAIITASFGAVLAFSAFRTSGPYFAMVTLAFGAIAQIVLNEWGDLTNGARGLAAPKPDFLGFKLTASDYYWLCLALFVAIWIAAGRIIHSHYGRAFQALYGSPVASDSLGVSTFQFKVRAFVLSAAITGLAGGLYIFKEEYVTPASFSFELTIVLLLALIVGGRKSRYGCLAGAVVAVWLPNILGDIALFRILASIGAVSLVAIAFWQFRRGHRAWVCWIPALAATGMAVASYSLDTMTDQRLTIFGLILLGSIVFLPKGLVGALSRLPGDPREKSNADGTVAGAEAKLMIRPGSCAAQTVQLNCVSVQFGGLKAVNSLSMEVAPGVLHGLIGPNGAGKSTVINSITGVYRPTSGAIRIGGREVQGETMAALAKRGVARTFQNIQLFGQMSVLDNVLVGRHRFYRSNLLDVMLRLPRFAREEREQSAQALALLRFVGLTDVAHCDARNLSYGRQRLLEIARALATEPGVLLLDEPAAGLTPADIPELIAILNKIKDAGITMILIEHHMDVVMALSDRVTVLDFGTKIAEGTPSQVKTDPKVVEAYLGTALSA